MEFGPISNNLEKDLADRLQAHWSTNLPKHKVALGQVGEVELTA